MTTNENVTEVRPDRQNCTACMEDRCPGHPINSENFGISVRVRTSRPAGRRGRAVILVTAETITNEQAAGITFRLDPAQVTLGAQVEVHDALGVRVGYLASATYHKPEFGAGYAICTIQLR